MNESKVNSLLSIAKKYGIGRKSIRDGLNKKKNLKHKKTIKRIGYREVELNHKYLKKMKLLLLNGLTRKLELPVTTTVVMNYILKLEPDLKDKSNKAILSLTYRFLQKFNFVLRIGHSYTSTSSIRLSK